MDKFQKLNNPECELCVAVKRHGGVPDLADGWKERQLFEKYI
jgi:hypothetical protein